MKAFAIAALFVLAACGQSAETPAKTQADAPEAAGVERAAGAVTPDGWGPVRIGMPTADAIAALGGAGEANAAFDLQTQDCVEFHPQDAPEGLFLMVEQGRVSRVSLRGAAAARTADGFGVGDEASTIKTALGARVVAEPHKYQAAPAEYLTVWTSRGAAPADAPYVQDPDARGIRYEIGENGAVEAVHAGGPSIQYVEGCA